MRRRWNGILWLGFLLVVLGAFTYAPVFTRFPSTRDFPWANLSLFGGGAACIAVGLTRAFREPDLYRGRIAGIVLGALGAALIALFSFSIFHEMRQVPRSTGAPRAGQKAPETRLLDGDGKPQTLASLTSSSRGVLLIFYRGFW